MTTASISNFPWNKKYFYPKENLCSMFLNRDSKTPNRDSKGIKHNFHNNKKLFLLALEINSANKKSFLFYIVYLIISIFLFPDIRQFIISPNHDEEEDASQHHREILRAINRVCHIRKSTGASKQEIYLHVIKQA